jgi:hypothetical protein
MRWNFVVAAVVLAVSTAAESQTQRLVVPAFYPVGGGENGWSRIQAVGSTVRLIVGLGGSGGLQTLTGAGLTTAQTQFNNNRAAGQLVLGYVDGTFSRALTGPNSVQGDVNAWYTAYPSKIDGVFFDIGPNFYAGGPDDGAMNQHYVALYQQTKRDHPSANVMLNAAGFPNDWVVTAPAADFVNVWETGVSAYANNYLAQGPSGTVPAPTWWSSYAGNTGRISNIVYGAGSRDVSNIVNLSRTRGTPMLYVHDQSTANYSALSCFFELEVAVMQNQTSMPNEGPRCPADSTGTCCTYWQTCVNGQCVCPTRKTCTPPQVWDDVYCMCTT